MTAIVLPDYDLLRELVVQLESQIHQEVGFDGVPRLITMNLDDENLSLIDTAAEIDGDPTTFLATLAVSMLSAASDAWPYVRQMIAARTFGWIVVFELETNFEISPVTAVLGLPLDKFPGTKLTRLVLGIDMEARVYSVVRQQGDQPQDLCGGEPLMHGSLPAALIGLNLAIARRVIGAEAMAEKLMSLRLLSHDEIDRAALDSSPTAKVVQEK